MKVWYIIGAVVIALVAAGGGFFGGMTFAAGQTQNAVASFRQQRAITNDPNATTGQNGQNFAGGQNPAGGALFAGNFGCNPGGGAQNPSGQNRQFGQNPNQTPNPNATPRAGAQQRQELLAELGNCIGQGTVKTIDGNTATISTAESVLTVKLDIKTIVNINLRGTGADLKVGDRVTVFSQETGTNPTASVIQVQRSGQ
jgi:hypothetical protein